MRHLSSNKRTPVAPLKKRPISRRLVLQSITTVPIWANMATLANAKTGFEETALSTVLDLLIPQDETPSASQIGVDKRLMKLAREVDNYPLLISEGLKWIDQLSQRLNKAPFSDAKSFQQVQILEIASQQPEGTLPQVFFSRIRQDAMALYYASPESWSGLGIEAPIQPEGYPDFAQPPET